MNSLAISLMFWTTLSVSYAMPNVLTMRQILPSPTDRAAFIGQTGSGKTTLAEQVCRSRKYVVAFDAKGMLDWDGYEVHDTLDALTKSTANKLTYRPNFWELQDPAFVNLFFQWVYERRNTTLYVDEIYSIAKGDVYPSYLGACLTRGRERGTPVYVATQRPARVPQIMLSEAEHTYIFVLRLPQDRMRMADITGVEPDAMRLPKHHFLYAPQGGDIIGPLKLNLSGTAQKVV